MEKYFPTRKVICGFRGEREREREREKERERDEKVNNTMLPGRENKETNMKKIKIRRNMLNF